jgi:predicted transcriptional regulator
MGIELQLVKDGRVLFRLPVRAMGEEVEEAVELDEEEIERLAELYSIAANQKRLRVMLELMKRGEMSFSEILRIAMNPKLVQDCMEPMVREGLVIHKGRGSGYRPSERGAAFAITMTAGFAKLLEVLESELEGDEQDE